MQGGVLCPAGGSGQGGGEEQPGRAESGATAGEEEEDSEKEEEICWSEPDRQGDTTRQLPVQACVIVSLCLWVNLNGFKK